MSHLNAPLPPYAQIYSYPGTPDQPLLPQVYSISYKRAIPMIPPDSIPPTYFEPYAFDSTRRYTTIRIPTPPPDYEPGNEFGLPKHSWSAAIEIGEVGQSSDKEDVKGGFGSKPKNWIEFTYANLIMMGVFMILLLMGQKTPTTNQSASFQKMEKMDSIDIQEEKSAPPLPEKFNFDQDDQFYLAPPTCRLIHYRHAAMCAGILEILILVLAIYSFTVLSRLSGVIGFWLLFTVGFILVVATVTTCTMIYGILIDKPHYLWPQMAFLSVEIGMTLIGATICIMSMSFGLEFTYNTFSPLVNVRLMEKHFGPIWPFNMAIISFSTSALGIWFHVIVKGCYEYMLDKEYFMGKASVNIEMDKKVDDETKQSIKL